MVHLIYSSVASHGFGEAQLPQLLEHTRQRNAQEGLTGMLLYVEGSFFQVLEGEQAAVDGAFGRIVKDPRHRRVTTIIRETIAARSFPDWTMGYRAVSPAELGEQLGENDFFGAADCLQRLGTGRARRLLDAFRRGRWRAEETGLQPVLSRMPA